MRGLAEDIIMVFHGMKSKWKRANVAAIIVEKKLEGVSRNLSGLEQEGKFKLWELYECMHV